MLSVPVYSMPSQALGMLRLQNAPGNYGMTPFRGWHVHFLGTLSVKRWSEAQIGKVYRCSLVYSNKQPLYNRDFPFGCADSSILLVYISSQSKRWALQLSQIRYLPGGHQVQWKTEASLHSKSVSVEERKLSSIQRKKHRWSGMKAFYYNKCPGDQHYYSIIQTCVSHCVGDSNYTWSSFFPSMCTFA